MDSTDQTELKHRGPDVKSNESESANEKAADKTTNSTTGAAADVAVIQTKDEYFNALRGWLQQVQLQQMAYTYFPYYLYSNLQSNPNNVFIPSMPFLSAQYPTFPSAAATFNQPNNFANTANGGNQANPAEPLNRPPLFANNFFQPNRNNYVDNIRQNMQILYQNGGFEYVIAPIWKRFLAEAIDVSNKSQIELKHQFRN